MDMELMNKPQAEVGDLRTAIDGLFEGFLAPRVAYARAQAAIPHAPSVDIRETDEEIVLYCDLPGVDKQDVQVEVRDNNLVLSGERKSRKEEEGWLRREAFAGAFYRAFALPAEVQATKVKASMNNGVLEVRLPKAEQAKPHRVTIA
jgi:HSP20 family protein